MSKVSIIIPVYNAEKTIERCIDSIIKQTYKNFEMILVDDGSTDNSLNICKNYQKKYQFIKTYTKRNGGPSSARNYGLTKINGQYVCFIDSDDKMKETYLENLLNHKADMTMCGYIEVYDKTIINKPMSLKLEELNDRQILEKLIDSAEYDYFNLLWNKLYDAEIIKKYNITFDESIDMGEDFLYNMEYLQYCNSLTILPDCLYYYTILNEGSLTSKFRDNWWETETILFERYLKLCKDANMNLSPLEIQYLNGKIVSCANKVISGLIKSSKKYDEKMDYMKRIFCSLQIQQVLFDTKVRKKINKVLLFLMKRKWYRLTYFIFYVKFKVKSWCYGKNTRNVSSR